MPFGKLLPREGILFELFNQHGEMIAEGARAFMTMIQNCADANLSEKYAAEIDAAGHQADRIAAEVNRLLRRTFITPINSVRILGLINALDGVPDLRQDSSKTLSLFDVRSIPEEVLRLGELCAKCCERVQHAVSLRSKPSQPQAAEAAIKTCEAIDNSSPTPTG
jgi:uncharacterized protein Yka (UPF0111/DUF47 family)